MTTRIGIATSHLEREAVFRLRYEVYARELQRPQRYVDHEAQRIEEPLDHSAVLFAAVANGSVVGTVRCNYARDGKLADYEDLYQIKGSWREASSVTTKLIVAPPYRNTALAYRLASAAYQQGLRDDIEFDFIDVYAPRVPFFTRLGYRVHLPEAIHPEFGPVVVMVLPMRDARHLENVGSPLLKYLKRERAAA